MSPRRRQIGPREPVERTDTIRQKIIVAISGSSLSAKEISAAVSISEKEVFDHLSHIQKTMGKKRYSFTVYPAKCKKCGFYFKKRERLKKPGKCPKCRGESITEPLFLIK